MNNNKNLVENCLKAIDKAKKLKSLNMFVTETYDLALKQAENNYQNILKQSWYFLLFISIKKNQYYFVKKITPGRD